MLHAIFHLFARELWPLIDVKILFPLKFDQICVDIYTCIDKICIGLVMHRFLEFSC